MSLKLVTIYFGTCNTFNNNKHKPQRLFGLRDQLHRIGFRVELVPVTCMNYCKLEMCGHEVFRCNIKHLGFNTYYNRDEVCERAVQAVIDASKQLDRVQTYFWLWLLIDEVIFRGKCAPKDYWPVPHKFEPICKDCCIGVCKDFRI